MGKLDILINEFNKKYKEDIASRGIQIIETQKFPFSSPRANYMLYGGIPRGRIIEFSGEENSGKTTSALDICANAQLILEDEWKQEIEELEAIAKPNKTQQTRLKYLQDRGAQSVVYIDCENTLDEDWARLLGVDVDRMAILKPQSQHAEDIFEMGLQMIETDEVGLMVIDSLGVMISKQAYEKTMEEKTYGGIAAALTLFSKKATLSCHKYNATIIGINQMRENMNSSYGGTITTGGKGWKHNCSVRLRFSKGAYIDEEGKELKRSAGEPAGNLVDIFIEKTKVCKPDRKNGFYSLRYNEGIDYVSDLIDLLIKYGLIVQTGSWFNFIDPETGEVMKDEEDETIKLQGRHTVLAFLKDETNAVIFEELDSIIAKELTKIS